MAYNVEIFTNSGFNATNSPDKPSLLYTGEHYSAPAINTLQERFLSYIDIKTTWEAVKNADFCRVGDWYYSVTAIAMTSTDVCRLSLLPDFILSAGGPGSIKFLDGVTERVHVAKSADVYAAYTESDPLTTPALPLEITIDNHAPEVADANIESYTIVESTIDLVATANNTDATSYVDASGNAVTVPTYTPITSTTRYTIGGARGTLSYVAGYVEKDTQTETLYAPVMNGIARARELGVESAVISRYRVPRYFSGPLDPGSQRTLGGGTSTIGQGVNFIAYPNAKNNRINYGEFTKYGLLTTAGNKIEYNAENIYNEHITQPPIICLPDLRPDGCPYYRFLYFNNDSSSDGFFFNAVAGSPWETVPLVYSEKSRNALDTMQFETEKDIQHAQFVRGEVMTGIRGTVEAVRSGMRTLHEDNAFAAVGAVIGDVITAGTEMYEQYKQFRETSELEALNFAIGRVVAPEIQFPYNSIIMRDYYKNGVISYRYLYNSIDVTRIDKLLTMYGYKYTKQLETTDFTNRPKFNFVRANGVSVTGLPKWWADGIAAQLSAGIRFWHVTPDPTIYTTGNE